MADEIATVLETFNEYIEAFNRKDARALIPFYDFPCLMINKGDRPKSIPHPLLGFLGFSKAIKELRQQGFEYSKVEELSAKLLRENLAVVSGMATRRKQDNSKLEDIGFTYTLRKTANWKIVTGVVHDPTTYLVLPKA